jgi:NADH:ubiquinone oxidoreductase subunit D
LPAEGAKTLRTLVAEIRRQFPPLVELYDNTASLQQRTVDTGFVRTSDPAIWLRRIVGRAGGRAFDARREPGYPPYDTLEFETPVLTESDVNARVWMRIREVEQSLALIEQILERLPPGPVRGQSIFPAKSVKAWRWSRAFAAIFWSGCG